MYRISCNLMNAVSSLVGKSASALLTVFLYLIFQSVLAQPSSLRDKRIVFDQLIENQSLSQSSINCVLQDRDGFLWIGTWSGLIRYDGYKTTVFHSENTAGRIQSNKILAIYEDKNGFLWIGTHMGGLFRYDKHRNTFDHYFHDTNNSRSLSNNNVWAIQEDKDGNLWVGTERGLNILRKETNDFDHIVKNQTPTLTYDFITDIHRSSANELWVSTEMGLNKLVVTHKEGEELYSFENYLYQEDNANKSLHNYIYHIEELLIDGKLTLWLSTKKGLKRLKDSVLQNFIIPNKPLSHSFFRSILSVKGSFPYLITGSEMGLSIFKDRKSVV